MRRIKISRVSVSYTTKLFQRNCGETFTYELVPLESSYDGISDRCPKTRGDDFAEGVERIRMGAGRDGLLYLNKSRDCLPWHRFTHEAVAEAVLYSFLERADAT